MTDSTPNTTQNAISRAPRTTRPSRHLPDPIRYGILAGANFELRDQRMSEARHIKESSRRRLYVEFARKHHRLAMQWIADARRAVRS